MGLDFRYGDDGWSEAHWAYSGFMRFRERLCAAINVNLRWMAGFEILQDPGVMAGVKEPKRQGNSWDDLTDPIVPLLNHSDCEGELTAEECRSVAPRLREIVSVWPDDDYDRIMATHLANTMDECAEADVPLEFC